MNLWSYRVQETGWWKWCLSQHPQGLGLQGMELQVVHTGAGATGGVCRCDPLTMEEESRPSGAVVNPERLLQLHLRWDGAWVAWRKDAHTHRHTHEHTHTHTRTHIDTQATMHSPSTLAYGSDLIAIISFPPSSNPGRDRLSPVSERCGAQRYCRATR